MSLMQIERTGLKGIRGNCNIFAFHADLVIIPSIHPYTYPPIHPPTLADDRAEFQISLVYLKYTCYIYVHIYYIYYILYITYITYIIYNNNLIIIYLISILCLKLQRIYNPIHYEKYCETI